MIDYNENLNQFRIIIPLADIRELNDYHRGLLGILQNIDINKCDAELKENLKSVYQLLTHLLPEKSLLTTNNLMDTHELLIKK